MIACCCITHNCPNELGRLVECFNRQDYADRFLLVVDASGQYPDQPHGDRWQVVSFKRRFRTIGENRLACVGLTPPEADMLAVWDSDEVFLSNALSSCVEALQRAPWAQARLVIETDDFGEWRKQETFNRSAPHKIAYHSGWAATRAAYCAVGGYPPQADEDWPLADKLFRAFGPSADSTADGRPWLAYSRGPSHLSSRYVAHGGGPDCFAKAWAEKGREVVEPVDLYPLIRWEREFDKIEIPETVWPRPW